MKKILSFIFVLLLLATSVAALAAPAAVYVGDDDTRASNPDAFDMGARSSYETTSFTLTNDGAETLSGFTGTLKPVGFSDQDLNTTITFNKDTAAPGETVDVTITSRVPEGLDAIDNELDEAEFKVGDLQVNAVGTDALVIPVNMQRENNLIIRKLEICIDGNCESVSRDGDRVYNIRPGDDVEIKVEVENRYNDGDAEDVDFEDVDLAYEIDDNDFDVDDDDEFDLDADEKKTITFNFEVDDDIEADDYRLTIQLDGDDDHNARHGDEWRINLDVERRNHELTLRNVDISSISCSAKNARVSVIIANVGERDENEAMLGVRSNDLNIFERQSFSIDDGETETLTETINLANAKPGSYRITVTSYYDDDVPSDEEVVTIIVPDCEEKEEPKESKEPELSTRAKELQTKVNQLLEENKASQRLKKEQEEPDAVGQAAMIDDTMSMAGLALLFLSISTLGSLALFLLLKIVGRA
ncbi:MAG: hypothetical protein ACE5FT_03065 [Candidatus Nanoarchaeia archaeon]